MSWFKIQNIKDNTLEFTLELQSEQKVSRTNVLSLLITSFWALSYPTKYPYKVRPVLPLSQQKQLIENNPLSDYLKLWDDLQFDAESLDFLAHNEIRLHQIVDEIVEKVEKIKELPVEQDKELQHDIHFIGLYRAVLKNTQWLKYLPQNLELETGFMYYPDPGTPDPYDELLKSLGL